MNALSQLPIQLLSALSFVGASIFLYYVFKVKSYNRIGLSSFVFWGYSTSLILFSTHLSMFQNILWPLFVGVNLIFILCFIYGIIISYKRGPNEQKIKVKSFGIFLLILVIVSILFFILAKFLIIVFES
jgi:hypothetical protein